MDSSPYLVYYAQLLGVGLLWITLHCSGMCGPIMAGLIASGHTPTPSPAARNKRTVLGVLAYQAGRAAMYAILGALAGLLGAAAEDAIHDATRISALVIAVGLLLLGFSQLPEVQSFIRDLKRYQNGEKTPKTPAAQRIANGLVAKLFRALPAPHTLQGLPRMAVSGFILGLLPCMLMFWVLGLAAASASPLHGALLMMTLVLLTTPVLLAAGLSSSFFSGKWRRFGTIAIPVGMILSGTWLALVGAAANGWIDHAHLTLPFAGQEFIIMLW